MTSRLPQFQRNIARSRDLIGLGQSIGAATNGLVDAEDMYRASLVQSISSLDAYIHGVVLDRAVDVVLGRIPAGAHRTFGLPIEGVQQIVSAANVAEAEITARSHLARRLAKDTFQYPDDIASALALVGVKKIWSSAFTSADTAKTAVSLIVGRRNRIVHQCDADPLSGGSPTPLSDLDAIRAADTVEQTVMAIDPHC